MYMLSALFIIIAYRPITAYMPIIAHLSIIAYLPILSECDSTYTYAQLPKSGGDIPGTYHQSVTVHTHTYTITKEWWWYPWWDHLC